MTMHDAAATGFERHADTYERARPSYPGDAVRWLCERARIRPGRTVVDLAAGTGKLTRLLPPGVPIVAVEPVDAMARTLARTIGGACVRGMAESIPLTTGAADVVTVAQAFHWFDTPAALAEIHRVLRPGGSLALIWNSRDLTDPVQQRLSDIVEPHRGTAPVYASGRWRDAFEGFSGFGPMDEHEMPYVQEIGSDGLIDRITSTSCIASLDPATLTAVQEQVRCVAREAGEPVRLPYVTKVYVADRID